MSTWEWIQLYFSLTLFGLVDALSPIRIAILLVLLSNVRPIFRSAIFILGLFSVSLVLGIWLDDTLPLIPTWENEFSAARTVLGLILGVGLLLIAIHTWYQHPSPPATEAVSPEGEKTAFKLPDFMQRLSDRILNGSVLVVFVGGIILQITSVKSLVLLGLALKEIAQWPISPPETLYATLYYIIISLLEMFILVAAFAISPENSTRMLNRVSNWLLRSTYRVVALVEGALAVYVLFDLLQELFALYRS